MRSVIPGLLFVVFVACTGGPGPIDQTGNGGSSGSLTSSSGGSSSGGSNGGGSSSGEPTSSGGSGSGGSRTISASEFSQACVESTDCVAVYEGSACDACKCPNAAIAKDSLTEYSTKFQTASTGCPTTDVACAADCAEATPTCAQGTCTINR